MIRRECVEGKLSRTAAKAQNEKRGRVYRVDPTCDDRDECRR